MSEFNSKVVEVEESKENFETWADRKYLSSVHKKDVRDSDVLIVPKEGVRDSMHPLFPSGTEGFYFFLKEHLPEDLAVEICVNEEDYKEFAFHSLILEIGTIVVTAIALPVLADLISEYIKRRIFNDENDANVRFEVTVVDKKFSKKIKFDGSPKDFKKFLPELKRWSKTKPKDKKSKSGKNK